MTTSMQKHLSEIERIKQAEADKETALHAYAAKNKAITEQDPHEPFDYYYAEKLARPLIEEDLRRNQFYTLAERQTNAASRYVADNVESICSILRADLESRCKAKPGFLANIGKRVSELSLEMFTAPDREEIAKRRQAAEDLADEAEAHVANAVAQIRFFEVSPEWDSFTRAQAAVSFVKF